MRDIEFRLWDKINKEFTQAFKLYWNGYIAEIDNGCEYVEPADQDQFILNQYTGLKDRNGVKIFEGDIVKTWHPFSRFDYNSNKQEEFCSGIWVCEWEKCGFVFNKNDNRCVGTLYGVNEDLSEVIGNIYENPDLMESE